MDASSGVDRLPDGPVRRMVAAANRHDLEGMVAEFADDYENVTPIHPARGFRGADQVRRNWATLFAGLPDLALTVHDATTAPDGTVWMEWSNRGTRSDGSVISSAGVAILAIRDDRIAAARFYLEPVERESGDVNAAVRTTVTGTADARVGP
ncbi:hypothetical protein BKD30_04715 [Tersicoccus phoenicis]|uniref:SnoaL-like domain-containing protein n=1 Tax=Tersicoccus phoenicis TaxID=554083 RepID=A0A1R1LGN1_9MICC|nr:nuclear transport factor 2 family protein [Tersicoccus phoenicis]OMH26694.1 hypothetical protein BKD30_04715 [Tersicoccus phoenicis]